MQLAFDYLASGKVEGPLVEARQAQLFLDEWKRKPGIHSFRVDDLDSGDKTVRGMRCDKIAVGPGEKKFVSCPSLK